MPQIMYTLLLTANMHGNEPTGRELTLAFIEHLVITYLAGTVSIMNIYYLENLTKIFIEV